MYREIPEGSMLICTNHARNKPHEVRIGMEGKGAIEKINLVDGTTEFIPAQYDVTRTEMNLNICTLMPQVKF